MGARANARTFADFEAAVLRDLAERCVQRQSARKAERLFDEMLRRGLKVRSLGELDDEGIVEPFERLLTERGYAPGSRHTWQKLLYTVRDFGADRGFLKRRPKTVPDMARPDASMNGSTGLESGLLRVFRKAQDLAHSLAGGRDYLMLALAMSHGVKPVQALSLRVGDVSPDCGRITLQGRLGVRPKSIRLTCHLQQFMRSWLEQPRVKEEGRLFPGKRKGLWTSHTSYPDRYSVRLKALCLAAGEPLITYQEIIADYRRNHVTGRPEIDRELVVPAQGTAERPTPSVSFGGPKTIVVGAKTYPVTGAQRRAIELLLKAFPDRVSLETLGRSGRERLAALHIPYPELREEILFPGKGGWGSEGFGIRQC